MKGIVQRIVFVKLVGDLFIISSTFKVVSAMLNSIQPFIKLLL